MEIEKMSGRKRTTLEYKPQRFPVENPVHKMKLKRDRRSAEEKGDHNMRMGCHEDTGSPDFETVLRMIMLFSLLNGMSTVRRLNCVYLQNDCGLSSRPTRYISPL